MLIQKKITKHTQGRGFLDITQDVNEFVKEHDAKIGMCNIFLHHTSASLSLCENADPLVQSDLEAFMERLVPDGNPIFQHTAEGSDDMPAHVRAVLTTNSLSVPINDGKLALGTWQGIYLWEHRLRPYTRKLTMTLMGE